MAQKETLRDYNEFRDTNPEDLRVMIEIIEKKPLISCGEMLEKINQNLGPLFAKAKGGVIQAV
jgi:hypothetical protein